MSSETFQFTPPASWQEAGMLVLPGDEKQSLVGSRAFNFRAKSVDGGSVQLEDFRGKVVVMDFWASWCVPCRAELPSIDRLHRELASKVEVLGVNGEEPSVARTFLKEHDYTFPTVGDSSHVISRKYGVGGIPRLLILDGDGVVRKDFTGARDEELIRQAIAEVLHLPLSNSLLDLSGKVSLAMLSGAYAREPQLTAWHRGQIEQHGSGLRWRNEAGVSWELTPDLKNASLAAGPEGNPYYDKDPRRGRAFMIVLDREGRVDGFEFLGEFYARVR